jgi:uncharacterized protein (TIGR02996 family)
MTEDESFLRTLLADPGDRVSRLVYADWLDDRADPRAEFLRIEARLAGLPREDATYPELRRRMLQLQSALPRWWLAAVGGLRATSEGADDRIVGARAAEVARTSATRTDAAGYELEIIDGATSGLTGAVAYLECRSKWLRQDHQDIHYHLRLRDAAGRTTAWEPHTYNPFFGCQPKFLEWYGDVVVFIYEEKHNHYVARVGFDERPYYCELEDDWVLNGREIGYRGWRETTVRRLSVPGLQPFPTLSADEAAARDLLPAARWE